MMKNAVALCCAFFSLSYLRVVGVFRFWRGEVGIPNGCFSSFSVVYKGFDCLIRSKSQISNNRGVSSGVTPTTTGTTFMTNLSASEPSRQRFVALIQILYLVLSIWILFFILYDRPYESLLGLTNLVIGAISYWWSRRFARWKAALELEEE